MTRTLYPFIALLLATLTACGDDDGAAALGDEEVDLASVGHALELGVNEDGDHFGASMVAADFDGDGVEDLAVGAPSEAPGPDSGPRLGAVFVYKGKPGVGLQPWRLLLESDVDGAAQHDGDRFGAALAAYDMDDDGDAELFVGAPGNQSMSGVQAGAVFVYKGSGSGPVAQSHFITQSSDTPSQVSESGDRFGAALAVAVRGTFGDSYLLVGAPGERFGGVKSGYVTAFRWNGSSGLEYFDGFSNAGFSGGAANGDEFGSALAAGDIDGDEISDIVVGAPNSAGRGAVYVLSFTPASSGPAPYPIVRRQKIQPTALTNGDEFGSAVATGNLNGDADGKKEVVIGAPSRGGGGRVSIYKDDATSGISLSLLQTIGTSTTPNDRLGAALATGNIDGHDGADLAVGMPGRNASAGEVRFFLSSSDGSVSLLSSHAYASADDNDRLGAAVALGDFDQSGAENPVAGSPGRNDGAGEALVFHDRLNGQLLMQIVDQESP
ncbi:hypothetical protein [Sorangium sp. So ce1000]|uniref:hypothetical protein n=1 Tax=Sorangium sp. So ce1000 TaxID=3133325 RepID=UPI003F5EB729